MSNDLHLTGIKFQYLSSGPASLAVPVTLPTSPEWPPQRVTSTAYPLSIVKGREVCIECCFQAQAEELIYQWLQVRAIRIDGPEPGRLITQKKITIDANTYSAYNGINGYLNFPVDSEALWEEQVGCYASEWQWQYQLNSASENAPWIDLEVTEHNIFITLDLPSWPWNSTGSTDEGPPPWLAIIRKACLWAQGSTDPIAAATLITQQLNRGGSFKYDFTPAYTGSSAPDSVLQLREELEIVEQNPDTTRMLFRCSAFTDRLLGLYGLGEKANCTDLSYMVLLLGNSIGCGLQTARIDAVGESSFDLNPSIPIGYDEDESSTDRFNNHEFLWMGDDFNDSALIFDPSIGFPEDNEQAKNLNPVVALPFGDQEGVPGYLSMLVLNPEECRASDSEAISLRIN